MSDSIENENEYDPHRLEALWAPVWDELKPFATLDSELSDDERARPRKYILDMFP